MAGKFVIKKGTTGKFRFNLVSTNGQVVATSEAYESKASAMTGIRAVKSLAADAVVDDQTAPAAPVAATKAAGATKKATPPAAGRAGGACGYYADVSLFGGPSERRGCGQTVPPGNARSASPAVTLPPEGSTAALAAADEDGVLAQYGPAVLLGGRMPAGSMGNPPTGPVAVSTKGKTSVSSTASVQNVDAGPVSAGSLRSTCTASKTGAKGSASVTKGEVITAFDANGNPKTTVKVPAKPPVNHTVRGKVDTGDTFKAVFNEQKKAKDGTLTVVALHLYLLGPTAVGDVVVAESHCRA
jgi:uncharacterized protein YegP (UPF0339 family)